jgi:hypothetical protein
MSMQTQKRPKKRTVQRTRHRPQSRHHRHSCLLVLARRHHRNAVLIDQLLNLLRTSLSLTSRIPPSLVGRRPGEPRLDLARLGGFQADHLFTYIHSSHKGPSPGEPLGPDPDPVLLLPMLLLLQEMFTAGRQMICMVYPSSIRAKLSTRTRDECRLRLRVPRLGFRHVRAALVNKTSETCQMPDSPVRRRDPGQVKASPSHGLTVLHLR